MGARVNIKMNLALLQQDLKKITKDKKILNEVGAFVAERNRLFARRARPLQGNDVGKFKSLKKSTIKGREYLGELNKTHGTFKASRSNLTLTGQLIDSISHRVDRGIIIIQPVGKRSMYKTGEKRSARRTPINSRNELLYKAILEISSKFAMLGLDPKGKKRVNTIVIRNLRRLLR